MKTESLPSPGETALILPTGTVTFLFTDIEGSTRLLEQDLQAYAAALLRHDAILQDAVAAHGGIVFETIGDAVYAAFAHAPDAVAAALAAQRRLASEDWGDFGALRVRMALHTGEVEQRHRHYFGPALYRCARLMALGAGGQVLLSGRTTDLARARLPAGASTRDLGQHHLKDLAAPEHVFQLLHPDLPADFPPLRSIVASSPARYTPSYPFPQPAQLVGREAELARLQRLLDSGRAGCKAILISGPAGAGKSALVGRLVSTAQEQGVLCLAGGAYHERTAVPFAPFQEALTDYLLTAPAKPPGAASSLGEAIGELRRQFGLVATPQVDGATGRMRLFGAVLALLRGLAERSPVLLCLEDLHAADASTLHLIAYLLRQTRQAPVVLVGTIRSDELPSGEPLAQLVATLERGGLAEPLQLEPLSAEDTRRLVTALVRRPVGHDLSRSLYAATEGNPLFVEQLVLALREAGRLDRPGGGWDDDALVRGASLPHLIRDVIGQRLARLSARGRQTLETAAILGHTFEAASLLAMLEPAGEATVLADLEEAGQARLLRETATGYAFSHGLLRDVVYWDLSGPRRRHLHARAGAVLERLAGAEASNRAAELAHHFALGGDAEASRAKVIQYSLQAGRQAAALSSYREALVHFRRACELIERPGSTLDPVLRLEALEGRGRAERELARWPECIVTHRQLLDLATTPGRRARMRGAIAFSLIHIGDTRQALEECAAGLAEVDRSDADELESATTRLHLQQLRAWVGYLQGQYRQLVVLGQSMQAEAASAAQDRARVLAHAVTAWGYMGQGRVRQALGEYGLALAAAERAGEKVQLATSHENLGSQHYRGGQFAAARDHLERAIALYRDSSGELRATNSLLQLCRVWLAEGELARAHEQALLAVELATQGQERWAADGYQILGLVQAQQADWEAALASFQCALSIRQNVNDMAGIVESTVSLGLVHQAAGRWADAREAFEEAVVVADRMDAGPPTVLAHRQLGRLLLLAGDRAGAAAAIERAFALAETMPETLEYAPTLLAMAEVCRAAGDLERALGFAGQALERSRPVDQILQARVALAELHVERGELAQAAAQAADVLAQAERLDARGLLSRVQLVQARVAAGAGDHPAAQAAFEAGLAAAEAAGTPYERAEVLRAYGAFLGASTSSPVRPAADLLAEAAAILGRLRGSVAAGPAIADEQELGLL